MDSALQLEVVHDTRFEYAELASQAMHLAHLQPLQDGFQQLLAFDLELDPRPDDVTCETDVFGNHRRLFAIVAAHTALNVRASSRVRVRERFAALQAAQSPPWEGVRDRLRYVARAPFETAVEFTQPSPYVPRLSELREYALLSFSPGRPVADGSIELMHRIHADFTYDGTSTDIRTPLAVAFAQRSGVCQDFAHVMAGALRMLGLPARYVSGYLLTRAAPDAPAMVGADASHAWVQVWSPQTPGVPADGWVDLDPTNDLVPGASHVRLAIGRDYGDVAPLSGVIQGGGPHSLQVAVHTRVTDGSHPDVYAGS